MSQIQNVVVAAVRPPILDGKADLLAYVKFLALYEQYVSQGGSVSFSACLPEGLRREARSRFEESLETSEDESDAELSDDEETASKSAVAPAPPVGPTITWDTMPAEQQKRWVHLCFRPCSAHVADKRLRRIIMEGSGFSKSTVREHLSFFSRVMDVCEGVLPPKKETVSIILSSLRPQSFADMVRRSGGKQKKHTSIGTHNPSLLYSFFL